MRQSFEKLTQTLHVVLAHRLQQVDRASEVVLVVFQRLALRLADMLVSSKVDHRFKGSEFGKHLIQSSSIQKGALPITNPNEPYIRKQQLSLRGLRYLLDSFEASHSTTQPR